MPQIILHSLSSSPDISSVLSAMPGHSTPVPGSWSRHSVNLRHGTSESASDGWNRYPYAAYWDIAMLTSQRASGDLYLILEPAYGAGDVHMQMLKVDQRGSVD